MKFVQAFKTVIDPNQSELVTGFGYHTRTFVADSVEQAKDLVEEKYGYRPEDMEEFLLLDKETYIDRLEEGRQYEILGEVVDSEYDTILLEKRGEWLYTTLKGLGYEDCPMEQAFIIEPTLNKMVEKKLMNNIELETMELRAIDVLAHLVLTEVTQDGKVIGDYKYFIKSFA